MVQGNIAACFQGECRYFSGSLQVTSGQKTKPYKGIARSALNLRDDMKNNMPVKGRTMNYQLCPACMNGGYCPKKSVAVVGDDKLSDPDYLRDFKEFVRYLDVSDFRWHEHLSNLYRDFPGRIVGQDGKEVFLDMEEFERPNIREWFRDFLKPLRDGARPRVREEARERVRILATVLSAHHPFDAMLWGVHVANDNCAPAND